mmetsp:Transcript_7766/g.18912  ORF Transcript_7766/g.18912 Transcript_7766/m.18912 type:complete len:546 (+) Transcript_7766:77-1714(+)
MAPAQGLRAISPAPATPRSQLHRFHAEAQLHVFGTDPKLGPQSAARQWGSSLRADSREPEASAPAVCSLALLDEKLREIIPVAPPPSATPILRKTMVEFVLSDLVAEVPTLGRHEHRKALRVLQQYSRTAAVEEKLRATLIRSMVGADGDRQQAAVDLMHAIRMPSLGAADRSELGDTSRPQRSVSVAPPPSARHSVLHESATADASRRTVASPRRGGSSDSASWVNRLQSFHGSQDAARTAYEQSARDAHRTAQVQRMTMRRGLQHWRVLWSRRARLRELLGRCVERKMTRGVLHRWAEGSCLSEAVLSRIGAHRRRGLCKRSFARWGALWTWRRGLPPLADRARRWWLARRAVEAWAAGTARSAALEEACTQADAAYLVRLRVTAWSAWAQYCERRRQKRRRSQAGVAFYCHHRGAAALKRWKDLFQFRHGRARALAAVLEMACDQAVAGIVSEAFGEWCQFTTVLREFDFYPVAYRGRPRVKAELPYTPVVAPSWSCRGSSPGRRQLYTTSPHLSTASSARTPRLRHIPMQQRGLGRPLPWS